MKKGVEMEKRMLVGNDCSFYVENIGKDFHTQYGFIRKSSLRKKRGIVKTNKGVEMSIFEPSFTDMYRKMKRHAQIITPKDAGVIIANTGITKNSFVVDIGSGSGALACFIGAIVRKVVTYDIDPRSIKTTKENLGMMGLKNVTVKQKDACAKIDEKNADVITIDMNEPWNAMDNAHKALRVGGFIAVYCPNITQMLQAVNEARAKGLIILKSIELIEREWVLEGRRARPDFKGLGHTGFISFLRKVK